MSTPVAVVGMAVLLPGAPDLDTYWRNLVEGVDAITDVPASRWDAEHYDPEGSPRADRLYCRRGGFVDELVDVQPTRFGIMPSSVGAAEPDQLIALQVAAAALEDAGGLGAVDRDRVGVVLGRGGYLTPGLVRLDQRVRGVQQLVQTLGEVAPELGRERLEAVRTACLAQLGPEQPDAAIGLVPNLAASRVANRLDLRGPAYTVDAACASSLVAVDQAVGELASGRCDVVLAGGVHHCHDVTLWSVFTQLRALSASQQIRPFSRDADGILIGEGTAVVVLKRLADAQRDGDRVYAVVRGTGVASDGRTAALASPDPGGQTRAVRAAWQAAGLDPTTAGSVGLLEAHGTATPAGDEAELTTLRDVFGGPDGSGAVLGSVKSMIGHTMPTAGVAGLVKAALAVHHGVLLPTLHCGDPHPGLAATRFRTLDRAEPWTGDGPRRAGVNAFGFGGINAHVVLEQAPEPLRPQRTTAVVTEAERVLRLAAADHAGLRLLLAGSDVEVLAAGLPDDARTDLPCRLAVVDPTEKRLALARRVAEKGGAWRGRNDVWCSPRPLLRDGGRVAFLFPGLESEFAPRVDDVAAHFGLPAPALFGGADLVGDVGRHGAAVSTVGRLLDGALRRLGVMPDAVAGHSVGEWAAMVAGGLYAADATDRFLASFDPDALQVPGLAFAALGTSADVVLAALADRGEREVVLSHDNAPHQAVVCGPLARVEALVTDLRVSGVLGQVLPFRSGFHTPMLAPYLAPLQEASERFALQRPSTPVWSGTTAAPFPDDEAAVRALFVRHLLEPVRFRPLVENLYDAGFRVFVQLGVGQLPALVGDTLRDREHLAVAAASPRHDGLAQLRRVACALWVEGAEPALPLLAPARTVPQQRHPVVRLDLGSSRLTLGPAEVAALRLPTPARVTSGRPDLDALLRETEQAAADVVAAVRAVPAPRAPHAPVVHVSLDAMPYLRDHCFFRQREGWPDDADRRPVVPATTILQHLVDATEASTGLVVVAADDVRFERWVAAVPASDVPLRLDDLGGGRVDAAFGESARGTLRTAPSWPAPPAPWAVPAGERPPGMTAQDLYDRRWMFHGLAFQGLVELTALGDRHARGTIAAPAAPGALLDNVGQLLGWWVMATATERSVVFPVGLDRVRLFGPAPAPGQHVHCLVRITDVTDEQLTADAQLVVDGVVWAEVLGWRDRRFDSHPRSQAVDRCVERNTHAEPQPGGWQLVHERWPDLATRDLVLRGYLAADEVARYEQQPPRARRGWLLGRIAVKDAVRRQLWDAGEGPVFPAEVDVDNDPDGRPVVRGRHGRVLPALDVSLAHAGESAVAVARPQGSGVGIDLEEVVPRTADTHRVALGPDELRLLAALPGSRDLWFTRFWAAKEAVAKAEGTGLRGRPRAFAVVAATEDALTVVVGDRQHAVRCTTVTTPPDLPPRTHVVAWTTTPPERTP
ncbi:MAG: type polyketide synthase [Frankiales bacterium]|nr:type polyketide synthase [Frankiales bacterium]